MDKIDKLFSSKKKRSGTFSTFTFRQGTDLSRGLASHESQDHDISSPESPLHDPLVASDGSRLSILQSSLHRDCHEDPKDDEGLNTHIRLGPEQILLQTEEAMRKSKTIRMDHSTHATDGISWTFLDPLPAGSVISLPLASRNFQRKRARNSPSVEENYRKLKAQYLARYQRAVSEITKRFPGGDRPPKSGRTGNDPESKVPLDGKRVMLEWNGSMLPIGEWGNNFNNFLGCLARRSDYFNPVYLWPSQPFRNLEAAWKEILTHFVLDKNPSAWDYVFTEKMPRMIQNLKTYLKTNFYLKYNSDWERFWHLDPRVDPIQFSALCFYWELDVSKKRSEQGKIARSFNVISHHGGSQSFAQLEHKLERKNKRPATIDEVAKAAYNSFPLDYDKDKKKKKLEIIAELSRSVQEASSQSQSYDDANSEIACNLSMETQNRCVEEVFGPNKKGRFRMRGVGARRPDGDGPSFTASNLGANVATSDEKHAQMEKQMNMMQEMMLSLVSTLTDEQRALWMGKVSHLGVPSMNTSHGDKVRNEAIEQTEEQEATEDDERAENF